MFPPILYADLQSFPSVSELQQLAHSPQLIAGSVHSFSINAGGHLYLHGNKSFKGDKS